jgi:hypothetical protein
MRPIDADKFKQDLLDKSFYPAIVARAIDNAPTVNLYEWISVEDKQQQPPVREEVIVAICDDSGDTPFKYTTSGWLTAHNGVWIVDNDVCPYVTHWMPLPTPPAEKEN